jgi:two-component system, NtrC family, nitrogen regulation sensor histidine kinase NtrY
MISERLLHTRLRYFILVLIVVFFTAAGFLFARSHHGIAIVFFIAGLISSWLIMWLYRFTNSTISYFFEALRNEDTTLQFPVTVNNTSLSRLYNGMNRLNKYYQEIKLQNEYNERYYRTLIQHSATGLLVLNGSNQVELINDIACRYAGVPPESTNPNILEHKNPVFFEAICQLQPGENHTYKQITGNTVQMLVFRAILLRRNEMSVKLISIQDIRQELESREIESYRKLISVLTHEIMNLLSPLTSVAGSLHSVYHPGEQPIHLSGMNEEILKTTLSSIEVITEQSNGLLSFMDNYRKLSRIPQPEIRPFEVEEWVDQLRIVYSARMKENGIDFSVLADRAMKEIDADKKLINQVIVNLVNNAMDAVMENESGRMISMKIEKTRYNRTLISLSNNGPLIPPEVQDKIFVPFFTTKKEGSGIGLSITQEIVKLHKGSLMLVSGPEHLTSFILEI